ncbi:HAD family hydrolase [Fluviispira multicolorata]|uniref:HAD-IA family hydrolase n=1 Tax=Fluviispira multicolorata TaxID=2654512 RepID=A0A833N5S2_9BACT|nr:HAD family phosphatase [Fluviispira multicolorata]KAB8028505.1 HAD-IA family hydrolase [Fluviispira multicolorata]
MLDLKHKILSKKAILWDFDGCLCDSERIHFLAYAKAFAQFGHTLNEYDYYDTFTHTGAGVAKEIETYNISCNLEEIRKEKAKHYWELISKGAAKIYPEIPEILSILKINGHVNAIASNSPAEEINLILSQQKDKLCIDTVVGIEPGMRKKPFPDLYNKALNVLNISPSEALVIEDSERGLLAAQTAGCEAIWIKTDLNDRFETKANHFSRLTHKQLISILK